MKIPRLAFALTSIAVLVAGCGRNAIDTGGGGDSPRRDDAALSPKAALVEKSGAAAKPVDRAAAPAPAVDDGAGHAPGGADAAHCNCANGACDVEAEEDAEIHDVRVGASPVRGAAHAPVTIVVFTDFQCPFCAKSEATMHELAAKYGDRLRLVFKNNPLPFHDNARLASRAALAAAEQGKFWEYHDALFAHQNALDRDALLGYANDLGLDAGKFRAAMDADRTAAAVDADVAEAKRLSVMGTPAFFVNGRRVVGAQPLAKFEALVDEALAAAR